MVSIGPVASWPAGPASAFSSRLPCRGRVTRSRDDRLEAAPLLPRYHYKVGQTQPPSRLETHCVSPNASTLNPVNKSFKKTGMRMRQSEKRTARNTGRLQSQTQASPNPEPSKTGEPLFSTLDLPNPQIPKSKCNSPAPRPQMQIGVVPRPDWPDFELKEDPKEHLLFLGCGGELLKLHR